MCSKSEKMVFVTSINRHRLCIIYSFFDFFVQKLLLTKNYFGPGVYPRGSLVIALVIWSVSWSVRLLVRLSVCPLVCSSLNISRDCSKDFSNFGPRVLQSRSLVLALDRWSIGWSVFIYLRDCSLVFSNLLHEVKAP